MTDPNDPRWIWPHQRRGESADQNLLIAARSMLAAKYALARTLPAGFVSDPALVILLSLYIDQAEGRRTTSADLVDRTGIDQTVVERWIKTMDQAGLVAKTSIMGNDELIALTDRGWDDVSAATREVIRSQVEIQDEYRRRAAGN